MPNCPVCGKEVQPTTDYCPVCGTNLRENRPVQSSQSVGYSSSYPPQPGTTAAGSGATHSHKKYIIAIIGALLIGLLVGGIIGFEFPVAADFTTVAGQVTIIKPGIPDLIMFNSTTYGNLTSAVFANHNYLINLPIGDTYSVSIQWFNTTATPLFGRCAASPSTFSSNNQTARQNFSC